MDARASIAQSICRSNPGFANGVVAPRRRGACSFGMGFIHYETWSGIADKSLGCRK